MQRVFILVSATSYKTHLKVHRHKQQWYHSPNTHERQTAKTFRTHCPQKASFSWFSMKTRQVSTDEKHVLFIILDQGTAI